MMPTLLVGDFILVNKFAYGIRLPSINTKVLEIGDPQRGDIIVFRYPEDPRIDYIKRVVGVPGDKVSYRNKVLYVNGERATINEKGRYIGIGGGSQMTGAFHLNEELLGINHDILIMPSRQIFDFDFTVPEGEYFVMGDNRDNSRDSRYWGTVPDKNLIGKAFMIWMNWDGSSDNFVSWERIGNDVK
jgi:signal peptidase I